MFFMSTWWGDSKNMQEIELSRWLFELPANWQHIFALPWSALKKPPWEFNFFHIFGIPSSSRHEKRCQMLETFFGYFNALKTHCERFWGLTRLLTKLSKNEIRKDNIPKLNDCFRDYRCQSVNCSRIWCLDNKY